MELYNNATEEITMAEFFSRFGINSFNTPLEFDISDQELNDYEVESWDTVTQQLVWKPISAIVVKPAVEKYYKLGTLKGTSVHRVLYNGEWVELKNHPDAVLVEESMEVVDMMVEDTENYLAEGQINHNTTPGGMAIPYHASVRIKLTGGQQIKKTINGKEAVIGIQVSAKTIKNKVARPWREVDFEIHFGKGIREDDNLFDALREYCEKAGKPVVVNGKKVVLEGSAAWKYFYVADLKTGEIELDTKFQKSAFREKVLDVPEFKPYIEGLMEACFIIVNDTSDHHTISSIDTNSVEEVEAAANQ